MPTRRRRITASALAVAALAVAPRAMAQTDSALAEALFRTARTLVAEGKFAEACPKFAESERIDPKLGTLMNLALCHQSEGKVASAWAEYTQAAELAQRAGQAERERVAKKSAADLEPKLPRVTLQSAGNDATVSWDGKVIGAAALGTQFPVDPGAHELVATAPGKKSYTQTITVAPGPGAQTLTIPLLEPTVVVAPIPVPPPPPPPEQEETTGGHPILAYTLIAGGAGAIVVGSIFGGLAFSEKSAANRQCTSTNQCTQTGLNDISTLKTDEATSTVAIGVGILAAGAGVVVLLVGKKHSHESAPSPTARIEPLVGPGRAGFALSGTF